MPADQTIPNDAPPTPAQVEAWRNAIRIDTFANYSYRMGVALVRTGDVEHAIASLGRAIDTRPNYPEAHLALVQTLAEHGRTAEAEAADRRARSINPHYRALAYFELGDELALDTKLDDALPLFEAAIAERPDLGSRIAPYYREAAVEHRRNARFRESEPPLRFAARLEPAAVDLRLWLGFSLLVQCRYDEALAVYDEALSRDTGSVDALAYGGFALQGLGRFGDALERQQRAAGLAPDAYWTHCYVGLCHQSLGHQAEAMTAYHAALDRQPDGAGALSYWGLGLLGGGDVAGAVDALGKAAESAPKEAWPVTNLGLALHAAGRAEEGTAAILRGAEAQPQVVRLQADLRPWCNAPLHALYDRHGVPRADGSRPQS